jgi:hypothetical protein
VARDKAGSHAWLQDLQIIDQLPIALGCPDLEDGSGLMETVCRYQSKAFSNGRSV